MPTTEERIAALEKQMAAWMDQRPTTYYTHQYSGEEIDNAVARALPNGAIDQAAGTFVRPNLLDNWYFGRPVDQRGGYVVYAGANLYSDASCTTIAGQVAGGPYAARAISAICVSFTSNATYYCKIGDTGVVRGYTGSGYTVDRWGILNNVTATLQNASLNIAYTESGWNLYTFLDNVLMPGTTYTLSCLYKASGNSIRLVCTWGTNKFFFNEQAPISDDWTLAEITGTIPADATIDTNEIVVQSLGSGAGNFSLKAIKLELGPTQTLAHREGDKWVINEVPDYGDQLRRCLRHDYILGNSSQNCPIGVGTAYSNDGVVCVIQLPEYMRTNPAVVLSGEIQIRFSKTQILTATSVLNYGFSGDKVQLYFPGLSGLTPGQSCDLYTQVGSRLEFNSNL